MKKGQKELVASVHDTNLCTCCGACVNLCPYFASAKNKTIVMDPCDNPEGRCYAFCPRTPTDFERLRDELFDREDMTAELGAVKAFYIARSSDSHIRGRAQHGGTVTTLLKLALQEGMIDTAVLSEGSFDGIPTGKSVSDPDEIVKLAKSKFIATPIVEEFNRIAKSAAKKIGVIATPCQTLAFAKMRLKPIRENDSNIDKLRLVIGLFCGWALSWEGLQGLLHNKVGSSKIIGLDIPPSKHHSMEVITEDKGTIEIPLHEVEACVRESCRYCFDMTAEFSDISVGSARLPEGWHVAKKWNQIIVRTDIGMELMNLAKTRNLLEFKETPEDNLDKLKKASKNRKTEALKQLAQLSGSSEDLLYVTSRDSVFGKSK